MTLLRWRESMSIGDPAVDADHQRLIGILNRLHYMRLAGDERAAIDTVLDDLVHYTRYHFGREEALMQAAAYPGFQSHRRLHRELSERMEMFRTAYRCGSETFDFAEFYDFLSDWLLVHILCEDMQLKPYLAKAPLAAAG